MLIKSRANNICLKLKVAAFLLSGSFMFYASGVQALTIVPGDGDVALNKTAKASHVWNNNSDASKAVDGTDITGWNAGSWNFGIYTWLALDLQQTYSLSRVDLYSPGASGGVNFTLYYSIDGQAWNNDSNWTYIGSGALNVNTSPVSIAFNDIGVQYLKVAFTSGGDWIGLSEIAAYGSTDNPVPEPATMLLFGTGLAGLAAVSRRKRS